MLLTIVLPLIFQVAVPLGLLGWLAAGRPPTRTRWLLRVILVAAYLVAIGLAGFWLLLPWYTPHLYGVCAAVAAIASFRRAREPSPASPGIWRVVSGFVLGASAAVSVGVAGYTLNGLRAPSATVDLAFPMRAGSYLVVNGGANLLINSHVRTRDPKLFPESRGQTYGVDIVKLGPLGFRARGALPADPHAYAIFGEPLYAPCAGEVLAEWDGLADLSPPKMDTVNPAGNAVLLVCDSVWVLLAHMKKGSVLVHPKDSVDVGTMLGEAGNTGSTGEPHLHIHAQRPGSYKFPLSGAPLQIRLGGVYPVRNRRLFGGQ